MFAQKISIFPREDFEGLLFNDLCEAREHRLYDVAGSFEANKKVFLPFTLKLRGITCETIAIY